MHIGSLSPKIDWSMLDESYWEVSKTLWECSEVFKKCLSIKPTNPMELDLVKLQCQTEELFNNINRFFAIHKSQIDTANRWQPEDKEILRSEETGRPWLHEMGSIFDNMDNLAYYKNGIKIHPQLSARVHLLDLPKYFLCVVIFIFRIFLYVLNRFVYTSVESSSCMLSENELYDRHAGYKILHVGSEYTVQNWLPRDTFIITARYA